MINNKKLHLWGGFLLISIIFFPDIHLSKSLPAFQVVDLTLPFTALLIFLERKRLSIHYYYLVFILFAAYIPITMAVNGRLAVIADYFEIYKLMKFLTLIVFFSLLEYKAFTKQWMKLLFITLVVVNLLHFYNVFGFHDLLYRIYGGVNLEYFGLNSLKEPATKRMTGTAGNPNINAIIFAFFALYFLPLKFNLKQFAWFLTAFLLVLMCQSRTAIVGLAMLLPVIWILKLSNWNWKNWLFVLITLVGMYLISWGITTDFYVQQAYTNNVVSGSVTGRIATWKYLFEMIKEYPIFGHGVNKDFFYKNDLYSENEYILMAWRYGVIGTFLYLLIIFIPLKAYIWTKEKTQEKSRAILFLCLILLVALTNNPLQDRTGMMLIAIIIGSIWPFSKSKKNHIDD